MVGTPGNDVLVTNGARAVRPGSGDDRVCVTRSKGRTVVVADRAGDDRVVVQSEGRPRMRVVLGPGEDYYRGGAGEDVVYAHHAMDGGDNYADSISTGAGNDLVTVGGSAPLADRVYLGPGADRVRSFATEMTPGARVAGGPGYDRVGIARPTPGSAIDVDVPAGLITGDDGVVLRFGAVEDLSLRAADAVVTVAGSDRGERLDIVGAARVDAQMGGGNDVLAVRYAEGPMQSEVDGGGGADTLVLEGDTVTTMDAPSGTATAGPSTSVAFTSFVGLHGIGWTGVSIQGGDGAESLAAFGCHTEVRGGGGADRLIAYAGDSADGFPCDSTSSLLDGEAGDDVMRGGIRDDTIIGGDGSDTADGDRGTDTCDAESTTRCENVPS